jgi:hypothetical protein
MKPLLFILIFGVGLLVGWLIFSFTDNSRTDRNSERDTIPITGEKTPSIRSSVPITLQRACELKRNFWYYNPDLATEAVIHNIDSLKKYIDTLYKYMKLETPSEYCNGCNTAGVALYFGRSYDNHYLLKKQTRTSYLLYDNYTVFLMPVFYSERNNTYNFRYADVDGTLTYNRRETVRTLNGFWSPLDDLSDDCLSFRSDFSKKSFSKYFYFFDDPEGFDLGHTKP